MLGLYILHGVVEVMFGPALVLDGRAADSKEEGDVAEKEDMMTERLLG